jgi:hypothetical protein
MAGGGPISDRDALRLRRMLDDYERGNLGGRPAEGRPPRSGVIRAKATSTITAGATGTVTLCTHDWTKLTGTGSTISAINDSLVPITHSGTDIRLYLAPDTEGRMAILVAFLCVP